MTYTRRLIPTLLFPLVVACGGDDGGQNQPMFTTASGGMSETMGDGDTAETADMDMGTGDGDGDTNGDGDGDTNGDGDGDSAGDGDGDTNGDGDGDTGGNCMTDPAVVGSSCGQGSAYHGAYNLGEMNTDMPIGIIQDSDNGQGNGAEDWYQVDFPLDANNPRPLGGMATISFAVNEGNDYRFEVYRDCGAQVYGQGLASEFGASAPPLQDWSFNDLELVEEQLEYTDNILWPTTVWVRVFRFQNDGECNSYQLQVMRN